MPRSRSSLRLRGSVFAALLAVVLAAWPGLARAENPCENALLSITENFISYLETLTEMNVISLVQLQRFDESLKSGRPVNPLESNRNSQELVHSRQLSDYLNQPLEIGQLSQWVREKMGRIKHARTSRNHVRRSTLLPSEGEAQEFPGGIVRIDNPEVPDEEVPAFEIMPTLVSRSSWLKYMSDDSVEGKALRSAEEGGIPVSGITLWSAAEFANRVSVSEGLAPYYQWGDLKWQGSAADGTLRPVEEKAAFRALKVSVESDSGGYRLPGIYEFVYLLQESRAEILAAHWQSLQDNPQKLLRPVTASVPVYFKGGQVLYDLLGSLPQWTDYWVHSFSNVAAAGIFSFGGTFGSEAELESPWAYQVSRDPLFPDLAQGIRLARTL